VGDVTIQRDARRLPAQVTGTDGHPIAYQYDAAGRVIRRTDADGFVLVYQWDLAGRLLGVMDGASNLIVSYEYDTAGRLSMERKGNGTATGYGYDPAGRLQSVTNHAPGGQVLSSFVYTFDANGNPLSMTTLAGTTNYRYDAGSRLFEVTYPDGRQTTLTYDASGNRVRVTDTGATTAYSHNALNETLTVGQATFVYDTGGNLVTRAGSSGTTTYGWDSQGQLVRVVHPTLGTFTYDYDALGRRVAEHHGGATRRWAWEGSMISAEYDGANQLVARYVTGYGLVSRIAASGAAGYYAFDAIGHTRQLTGPTGAVIDSYDYTPFGEPLTVTESIPNPFRYAGRFGVMTDTHGLLQMRARSYDPALGRFVSPDPIRYAGGFHLYGYAAGNPMRYVDPSGLDNPGLDVWNLGVNLLSTLLPGFKAVVFIPVALGNAIVGTGMDFYNGVSGGDWGSLSHGVGNLAWGFAGSAFVLWTASNATFALVAGTGAVVAVAPLTPVFLVAGLIIAADEYGTAWYIENSKNEARRLYEHPVERNPWASFHRMPDGKYPQFVLDIVARELGRPELRTPGDPNGKTSTPGAGPSRRVHVGDTLSYTLFFQNVPTAGAPAQEVFLDDLVDPALDLSTLRVAEIGWGTESVLPPPDAASFALRTRVPDWRTGNAKPWWVDVISELGAGGRLRFTFRTIDPETGAIPEDPLAGFLPPDDATGRGQGWVTFTARTKTNLPTGTRIVNSATIVFDTEAPITTNEVFNTIGISGDVNDDGVVNPADVFYFVNHFYSAGPAPLGVADVNFDGRVDALDLFYLINYLYAGGPAPL
jgi:RHS repeat-associated protein